MADIAQRKKKLAMALIGLDELIKKCQIGEPLWLTRPDGSTTVLNEDEYVRRFPVGIFDPRPSRYMSEGSRATSVILACPPNIIQILMNVNRWPTVFSGIASPALTWEVVVAAVGGSFDGTLIEVMGEFHFPSPVVPTRESHFLRYSKKYGEGKWAIVDVSLDKLYPNQTSATCRRRPSGCIIEELPNGCSKVTWVEHVEVDNHGVHHLYKDIVSSCQGFGATRWIYSLDRQCQRLASSMEINAAIGVITNQKGKAGMLKLAERMVSMYFNGVSASNNTGWAKLLGSGIDDVKIATRSNVDEPGRPLGVLLCATHCLWLPIESRKLFDFFRDENNRNNWDVLCKTGFVQKIAHIENGRDSENSVYLLRVNAGDGSLSNTVILQENSIDATGSFVVYAPMDTTKAYNILDGGDPQFTAFLPSGFAIFPNGPNRSLLTISFQIQLHKIPTAKFSDDSIDEIKNLIADSLENIKTAVMEEVGQSSGD